MSLDKVKEHWDSLGIDHYISHYEPNNTIHVSKIVVPKVNRGKGIGSTAMKSLTDHADKHGHKITLSPATDFGASSKNRLIKFYKNHGFVENKGRHKDYSISETMYRKPNMSEQQKIDEVLNKKQMDKAEQIVQALKQHQEDFKNRYGDRWKSILHAITNKHTQKKQGS
jgi:predicted GNAT family acetyltransferase